MKAKFLISGILLGMVMSTACAKTDSEPQTTVADNSEATSVEQEAIAPAEPAPQEKSGYNFSDAMRIPVDGSSLESFERSLETIKSKADAAEYTTLTGAIDYLLLYDLGAKRDRAKLAQHLDGLTGEQIVDRVEWGK
jgi:hypothetical protein